MVHFVQELCKAWWWPWPVRFHGSDSQRRRPCSVLCVSDSLTAWCWSSVADRAARSAVTASFDCVDHSLLLYVDCSTTSASKTTCFVSKWRLSLPAGHNRFPLTVSCLQSVQCSSEYRRGPFLVPCCSSCTCTLPILRSLLNTICSCTSMRTIAKFVWRRLLTMSRWLYVGKKVHGNL